jgi:hypothetical protein
LHATEVDDTQDDDEHALLAILMDGVLSLQYKFEPKITRIDAPANN